MTRKNKSIQNILIKSVLLLLTSSWIYFISFFAPSISSSDCSACSSILSTSNSCWATIVPNFLKRFDMSCKVLSIYWIAVVRFVKWGSVCFYRVMSDSINWLPDISSCTGYFYGFMFTRCFRLTRRVNPDWLVEVFSFTLSGEWELLLKEISFLIYWEFFTENTMP